MHDAAAGFIEATAIQIDPATRGSEAGSWNLEIMTTSRALARFLLRKNAEHKVFPDADIGGTPMAARSPAT
jgi:hypothetical protein